MIRTFLIAAATAATLCGAAVLTASPAAADPWGYHHHREYGFGFGFGPPVFAPPPVYYEDQDCYLRRRWVRDYRGWHRIVQRVCN